MGSWSTESTRRAGFQRTNHNMKSPMTTMFPRLNCLIFNHKEVNLVTKVWLLLCLQQPVFLIKILSIRKTEDQPSVIPKLWFDPEREILNFKYKGLEKSSGNRTIYFLGGKLMKFLQELLTINIYYKVLPLKPNLETKQNKQNRKKFYFSSPNAWFSLNFIQFWARTDLQDLLKRYIFTNQQRCHHCLTHRQQNRRP